MSDAATLARLAAMQQLKEKQCGSAVARAQAQRARKSRQAEALDQRKRAAEERLTEVLSAPLLCPDRMLLAAGHLSKAEDAHARGRLELEQAKQGESDARNAWQEARFRSDHMEARARSAKRQETRRSDDTALAERMSLRAALSKGPQS